MATSPVPQHHRQRPWPSYLVLPAFALLAFLIDGYHPWSEDGGIYAAAIERLLDPSLFPQRTAFVTAYDHLSLFPITVAAIVRTTQLPLAIILLALHLASLWLLLYAARALLRTCNVVGRQQLAALALLAVWSSLPIAGTSLLLTDPYVTARSFSTPLTILAISFALRNWSHRRDTILCLTTLLLIGLIHPLGALHATGLVIATRIVRHSSRTMWWRISALLGTLLVAAAIIHTLSPRESPQAIQAAVSRYYWFLSQWHWYELLGLAAPCGILSAALFWQRSHLTAATRTLLRATLLISAAAFATTLLFIHPGDPQQLLDRTQPLRLFLFTYVVMTLLIGATLSSGKHIAEKCSLALLLVVSAAALTFAQRDTYAHSAAYEWPWTESTTPNRWQQAFLWIRTNTPREAFFALDASYITQHEEDAQLFRPLAQRSSLADRSKDGGIVANLPSLAPLWASDVAAQADLSTLSDAIRDARLRPLGVTWMLLRSGAPTRHACPYDNHVVKVCRLDQP